MPYVLTIRNIASTIIQKQSNKKESKLYDEERATVVTTLADSMISLTLSLPCFLEYIASSLWEITARPVILGSL